MFGQLAKINWLSKSFLTIKGVLKVIRYLNWTLNIVSSFQNLLLCGQSINQTSHVWQNSILGDPQEERGKHLKEKKRKKKKEKRKKKERKKERKKDLKKENNKCYKSVTQSLF